MIYLKVEWENGSESYYKFDTIAEAIYYITRFSVVNYTISNRPVELMDEEYVHVIQLRMNETMKLSYKDFMLKWVDADSSKKG